MEREGLYLGGPIDPEYLDLSETDLALRP